MLFFEIKCLTFLSNVSESTILKTLIINQLYFLNCGPINFKVEATKIIGLSGKSGSGKSRLLRALADLDEHQGEIILDDIHQQNIDAHQWRKKVALLSAETQWWFDTVEEHFLLDDIQSITSLKKSLTDLGFSEDSLQWNVSRLSSGEKQRLGLLRLLQNQPDVLLLDEPTANLDKHNTKLFENFVLNYLRTQPACAVWVSHDLDQLQRNCQQQVLIKNGELVNVD